VKKRVDGPVANRVTRPDVVGSIVRRRRGCSPVGKRILRDRPRRPSARGASWSQLGHPAGEQASQVGHHRRTGDGAGRRGGVSSFGTTCRRTSLRKLSFPRDNRRTSVVGDCLLQRCTGSDGLEQSAAVFDSTAAASLLGPAELHRRGPGRGRRRRGRHVSTN
jgi:hypothetical protein